jgi:hypothetical protein
MILFLHPPDSENGLDSKVLLEELLASMRTSARDLTHREEFTTLSWALAVASLSCCSRSRPGPRSLLKPTPAWSADYAV